MRAVIVYESMFGNTHAVAEAIGEGLEVDYEVDVAPVAKATRELLEGASLLVVGGPTHAHGMSRSRTRRWAVAMARKPGSAFTLESGAEGPGLDQWFASLGHLHTRAAAFDTRLDGLALCTGRASKVIYRRLRRHGLEMAARPESFIVTKDNQLAQGEESRARRWGEQLGEFVDPPARRETLAG
jgi:hypothetical protein